MAQPDSSLSPEMETSASGTPPEEPTQPVQALGAPKKRGPGAMVVVLIAIIVVLAAALAIESISLLPKPAPPAPTIGPLAIQSATAQVSQGQQLSFTLTNLTVGDTVTAQMGDGGLVTIAATANSASFQYSYNTGGTYLIWVQERTSNGTLVSDTSQALLRITVVPSIPSDLSLLQTAPTIYFDNKTNPTAPLVKTTEQVSFFGGSAISPFTNQQDFFFTSTSQVDNTTTHTVTNVTTSVIPAQFVWDFGNGKKTTANIAYDPSSGSILPDEENQTYSTAGLYDVTLTMVNAESQTVTVTQLALNGTYTANTTSTTTPIATYSYTVGQSIASGNFAIAANFSSATSSGVITEIVNSPGGPYSFDPQIDYETTGAEVVFNTAATLLFYQSNSTTIFIPYIADSVPSIANGGITNNNQTYTFHIRSGVAFSNGDPVTAYDVYYTYIRSMLFQGGYPGTANWINTQYLIAPPTYVPFTPLLSSSMSSTELQTAYNAITASVTYDSTANTVTFHLWKPYPASLFYTALVDPLGGGIVDAKWLESVGAGITFTPAGFLAYESQSFEGGYNANVQFAPVASGPYMISVYTPGTAVVLKPNPGWPGVAGIPKATSTAVIKWALDENVAYQLYVSGQGDIVTLLPPQFFPRVASTMGSSGVIHGPVPELASYFAIFNLNISQVGLTSFGTYSIPTNYFANPYVREAFADAFDYVSFLNTVLGNVKYGYNFGSSYCGVIVKGLQFYQPPQNFTGCPSYSLAKATSLLYQSGLYNTTANFPIIIPTGDPTDFSEAGIWGDALTSIDPHITVTPTYLPFNSIIGDSVPGANGMPLYFLAWFADYPYPSDFTDAMYLVNGTYPGPDGWDPVLLGQLSGANGGAYTTQFNAFETMTTQLLAADAQLDPTLAAPAYKLAQQSAINLYMYVYTYQPNNFWMVRSYMQPYNNDWGYQTGPTIGGAQDSLFFYWIKG